jgi:hypothetical protein
MNGKRVMEPRDVENRLENAFRPVSPSRKFVQKVRTRISLAPSVIVAERFNDTPRVLLLIGGVVAAVLLLASAVRALFYLLNKSK